MPITIREVAAEAGVSQATAARALNGYGSTSAAARERVARAAEKLGYETNYIAQALRAGVTRTVTFLPGNLELPFFATIAHRLSDALEDAGYLLAVSSSYEDVERERRIIEGMRARMSPGLIVASAHRDMHEHLRRLNESGVAVVAIDRSLASDGIDSITVDNYALGGDAARYFIGLGHRRVGLVFDSEDIASSPDRTRGAVEALREAGCEALMVRAGTDPAEAESCVRAVLAEERSRPTALIAFDSLMTEAALYAVREAGLAVPRDISVMGVDDHTLYRLLEAPLTVMAQPVDRIGQDAAALMVNRLSGTGPRGVVDVRHRAELVVRSSTAPPAG